MKSMINLIFICLSFLSCVALADNLTTKDGRTYYDVSWITNKTTLHSINISHKAGFTKLNYDELKESDRIKYGYNADAISAEVRSKTEALKAEERSKMEALEAEQKKLQLAEQRRLNEIERKKNEDIERQKRYQAKRKIERQNNVRLINGTYYDCSDIINARNKVKELEISKIQDVALKLKLLEEAQNILRPFRVYLLSGKVMQILPDGVLVTCEEDSVNGYDGIVFVKDWKKQDTAVDGDSITVIGLPIGRYQYIATGGANKTVTKFACARKVSNPVPDFEIKQLP